MIHPDRELVDRTVLLYARLYLSNLPLSRTHSIDTLRPLEQLISELLGTDEWHADDWPLDPGVVSFTFADDEADIASGACYEGTDVPIGPLGPCARIVVDTNTGRVKRA